MNIPYSIWSSYFSDLTPEAAVDELVKAGFSCTEFSDEHGAVLLDRVSGIPNGPEKAGSELKRYADDKGFTFPQGHLFLKVDLCSDEAVDVLKRWLDLFVALDIRAGVLHAAGGIELSPEARFDRWVRALTALTDHLKGTNMSIALENLRHANGTNSAEDILTLIDAVGSDHLGICLDTGHLNLTRSQSLVPYSQSEFIRRAGKKLIALHIADNDTSRDQHILPFSTGNVDWKDVMTGLREVNYQGLFNLEIPGERVHCPLTLRRAKLPYIHAMCREMLSDDFLTK